MTREPHASTHVESPLQAAPGALSGAAGAQLPGPPAPRRGLRLGRRPRRGRAVGGARRGPLQRQERSRGHEAESGRQRRRRGKLSMSSCRQGKAGQRSGGSLQPCKTCTAQRRAGGQDTGCGGAGAEQHGRRAAALERVHGKAQRMREHGAPLKGRSSQARAASEGPHEVLEGGAERVHARGRLAGGASSGGTACWPSSMPALPAGLIVGERSWQRRQQQRARRTVRGCAWARQSHVNRLKRGGGRRQVQLRAATRCVHRPHFADQHMQRWPTCGSACIKALILCTCSRQVTVKASRKLMHASADSKLRQELVEHDVQNLQQNTTCPAG